MALTRRDYIAQQLRGISPGVEWNVQGIDRADELAGILDRAGILELWRLQLIPAKVSTEVPEIETESGSIPARTVVEDSLAFNYGGRVIGYLGTPDHPVSSDAFQITELGPLVAWSAEGHGHVSYVLATNPQTKALSIVPRWGSSSDAAAVRQGVIAFASFFLMVLPMAGISIAATIGNAVLPATLTASYPALASVVGNVAISTALNGGNVGDAVVGALTSGVANWGGAQIGDFAALASESQFVGSLASAATRAVITGGNIGQAVGMAALSEGSKMDFSQFFGDTFNDQAPIDTGIVAPDLSSIDIANGVDFSTGFNLPQFTTGIDVGGGSFVPSLDPTVTVDMGVNLEPLRSDVFNPTTANGGAVVSQLPKTTNGTPIVPPVNAPANSPVWSASQVVQGVSNVALSALKIYSAFRNATTPTVQRTARQVNADGSVSIVSDNGLIQTRNVSGQVVSTRPPVGVPQSTITGNMIVNNGDGTYTVATPTGQTQRLAYGTTSGAAAGGGLSPLMIGGGILAAVLLLRR